MRFENWLNGKHPLHQDRNLLIKRLVMSIKRKDCLNGREELHHWSMIADMELFQIISDEFSQLFLSISSYKQFLYWERGVQAFFPTWNLNIRGRTKGNEVSSLDIFSQALLLRVSSMQNPPSINTIIKGWIMIIKD